MSTLAAAYLLCLHSAIPQQLLLYVASVVVGPAGCCVLIVVLDAIAPLTLLHLSLHAGCCECSGSSSAARAPGYALNCLNCSQGCRGGGCGHGCGCESGPCGKCGGCLGHVSGLESGTCRGHCHGPLSVSDLEPSPATCSAAFYLTTLLNGQRQVLTVLHTSR